MQIQSPPPLLDESKAESVATRMDGDEPEQDVRQDVGPDTPQQEDDVPPVMAGVGMHAGKSSGGQAGRRIVGFESSGATLDLEAMGGDRRH